MDSGRFRSDLIRFLKVSSGLGHSAMGLSKRIWNLFICGIFRRKCERIPIYRIRVYHFYECNRFVHNKRILR